MAAVARRVHGALGRSLARVRAHCVLRALPRMLPVLLVLPIASRVIWEVQATIHLWGARRVERAITHGTQQHLSAPLARRVTSVWPAARRRVACVDRAIRRIRSLLGLVV